jgi:hypothetical protein
MLVVYLNVEAGFHCGMIYELAENNLIYKNFINYITMSAM